MEQLLRERTYRPLVAFVGIWGSCADDYFEEKVLPHLLEGATKSLPTIKFINHLCERSQPLSLSAVGIILAEFYP
ncbi:hypothetical protein CC86DRAFT_375798 [Ophiobolus disseminans]|uniref:Uncharacterized protein n=1 Tax=Ophiobolus disseminans TaxID=1469910 RepID=A0A6A6ZCM5_9PLEO|nr:hypothetical protein CC86DRAFT_375798 [Ophiobolus disseminans]